MLRWFTHVFEILARPILFVGGFLGVVHETLVMDIQRPALLALYGAMMGLPTFLQSMKRNGNGANGR